MASRYVPAVHDAIQESWDLLDKPFETGQLGRSLIIEETDTIGIVRVRLSDPPGSESDLTIGGSPSHGARPSYYGAVLNTGTGGQIIVPTRARLLHISGTNIRRPFVHGTDMWKGWWDRWVFTLPGVIRVAVERQKELGL